MDPGTRPRPSSPYRNILHQLRLERDEINNMIAEKVTKSVTAEWASPVVFIPKKDGSLRFCIDHKGLYSMTVRESYPISKMD